MDLFTHIQTRDLVDSTKFCFIQSNRSS